MPQVLEGIAAVQESGFQLGMACKCRLHAFGVNLTAGLLLQVFIAADVVCIGVGVDDGVQAPSFPVHDLAHFPSGILITAAVNQTYPGIINLKYADFGRAVNIEAPGACLYQFIHTIPPCFYELN